MKLTKRGALLIEGAPSRASVIESRFAAYPRCSTDVRGALLLGFADDFVQTFNDLRQFRSLCTSEATPDAFGRQRPNLTDLDP